MNCYRLIITYEGTRYCGWQVQPNGIAIQEILQKNFEKLLKRCVNVIASGRTDAGVHALGQVAHFHFDEPLDLHRLLVSINGLLPPDIRVLEIALAPDNFHSRYSAKGKEYHYHLTLDRFQSPFDRGRSWHIKKRLNLDIFHKAAKLFVGTHDFSSFANEAHSGAAARDAVRTIWRLDIVPEAGGLRLEFEGNGFLYKMVRNIVGTIVDTAGGKISLEDIQQMFEAKDRRLAGRAAPPYGLFLVKVRY